MSKFTLDQLRSAFKKETSSNRQSNVYPFWEIPLDTQAVVRFLPDLNEDNPMGFMVEKLTHTLTIDGKNKVVPCLKMYDEECPICKLSASYYKEGDEANGKKFWRKKQHIAQALIVKDPIEREAGQQSAEGSVMLINMTYQLFTIIKDAFESGELDEVPFAYEGGTNLMIKRTAQGDKSNYTLSRFAKRATDLTEDEIAEVREHMVDLSSVIPENPGLAKVEAMLEAALTGSTYDESSTNFKSAKPAKPAPSRSAAHSAHDDGDDDGDNGGTASKVPSSNARAAATDDDDSDEADRLLAQIRSRPRRPVSEE